MKTSESRRKQMLDYYEKHKERILLRIKERRLRRLKEVFELLGGRCTGCGFHDERAFLVVRNKKIIKRHAYLWKKNKLKDFELLCANCFSITYHKFTKI